ncbi:alpha/beta hydrolase [Spongiactinospora sp. TRM90649]|uniref:alpha/beta hydrolase n=1 Tax=Spongiactinospora sp. TRM90649 TaxID=3031114 RepID=UPI0023F89389|nr:alpha/beta hydrolase [Spongiactinospora sp. TRM90649]MDF5757677.1 alpha/beta hydrolase [Spongiactinospora sp. TRM90649]
MVVLVVGVVGVARPSVVGAPVPVEGGGLGALSAGALAGRYDAGRRAVVAAERVAAANGDRWRAGMLRAMADPARHYLSFDGRDGGRVVEVVGDLATAERIAVLVPGSDTNLDKYGLLRGGSVRLAERLGPRSAVVAWLGYRTPSVLSLAALTPGRAEEAAPALRAFTRELAAARPAARISLVCHSYGAVVCAKAAPGVGDAAAAVVLYGSAGVAAGHVAALRTRAAVWTGRAARDWIGNVPHVSVRLPFAEVGFGRDSVSPAFGARVFAAGGGGHSDYLRPGLALENIARIVMGQAPHA